MTLTGGRRKGSDSQALRAEGHPTPRRLRNRNHSRTREQQASKHGEMLSWSELNETQYMSQGACAALHDNLYEMKHARLIRGLKLRATACCSREVAVHVARSGAREAGSCRDEGEGAQHIGGDFARNEKGGRSPRGSAR